MDERLKQRLVGAAVLVLAAVIFVPMLLDQGDGDPKPSARIIQPLPLEPMPPPLPEAVRMKRRYTPGVVTLTE